jgi:hypothetical protein
MKINVINGLKVYLNNEVHVKAMNFAKQKGDITAGIGPQK